MRNFDYFAPTEIVFGNGRIEEIGSIALRYGKKALLVTMPEFSAIKPVYDKVRESLKQAGVEYVHFDGVIPNPTTDTVTAGARIAKEQGVELVIGLGGGSSMDTAKAIAVEATHPGTAWDYNCHTAGPGPQTLPIIAIGTTAGTGSQTTPCAVITKSIDKDKSAIWHKNIFSKVAIVDPEATATMPKSVTAQTGFDAFCHNFEAYISVNSNPLVEVMALDAIKIICEYLPRAYEDGGDMEAREKMAWADTLGGLTNASAGVTLPHGLGMQIGGHCPHVSHGCALAIQYPQFIRYTWKYAVKKFAAVARIFDPALCDQPDDVAAEALGGLIDGFLKTIGLWIGFDEMGVTVEDIRQIADCGQVLGDYKNNPRVATIDEMYDLLMHCRKREE